MSFNFLHVYTYLALLYAYTFMLCGSPMFYEPYGFFLGFLTTFICFFVILYSCPFNFVVKYLNLTELSTPLFWK